MMQTKKGAKKAAQTLLAKDPDHFKKLAAKANAKWEAEGRKPRGFAARPDLASEAGKKGGQKSKRRIKL